MGCALGVKPESSYRFLLGLECAEVRVVVINVVSVQDSCFGIIDCNTNLVRAEIDDDTPRRNPHLYKDT